MGKQPAWRNKKNTRKSEHRIGPIEVVVYNNDVNQALKILKTKIANEGILQELKRRRAAEKPSEKKRRKHREALKRNRKTVKKSQHRSSRSKVVASVPE